MTNEKFTELINQYERLVFTICYQMVKDYHEAQNLAQEVFLSAYRSIDRCPPENHRPWLSRVAANKAKDYLKSAYSRRVSAGQEEHLMQAYSQETPEQSLIEQEGSERVAAKIQALNEPYHKVSVLYFLEEKSPDEIARLLDRPPKTVQTQLYRARRILQQRIREEDQYEPTL